MEIVEKTEQKATKELKRSNKFGGAVKTLFTKRKKLLILSTMFVLLCVTGYLNFALNSSAKVNSNAGAVETNMFNIFRTTRADERTRDIMVYENLIAQSQNAATVASAEAKLQEIRGNVAFETSAEGLLTNSPLATWNDVIVDRTNGFVNVLIKQNENITRTQAISIMTILNGISPELDIDNVYISIME